MKRAVLLLAATVLVGALIAGPFGMLPGQRGHFRCENIAKHPGFLFEPVKPEREFSRTKMNPDFVGSPTSSHLSSVSSL